MQNRVQRYLFYAVQTTKIAANMAFLNYKQMIINMPIVQKNQTV